MLNDFHNRLQHGYDEVFFLHLIPHVVASAVGMLDPWLLGGTGFFIAVANFSETIILSLKLSSLDTFLDVVDDPKWSDDASSPDTSCSSSDAGSSDSSDAPSSGPDSPPGPDSPDSGSDSSYSASDLSYSGSDRSSSHGSDTSPFDPDTSAGSDLSSSGSELSSGELEEFALSV